MGINRREFIWLAGLSTLFGLGGKAAWELLLPGELEAKYLPAKEALAAKRWAMVVDMRKVDDKLAKRCIDACHAVHNVPNVSAPPVDPAVTISPDQQARWQMKWLLELSAMAEPLDTIHARLAWRYSLDGLRTRLDDMAARGLILRGERHGTPQYGKLPFVLGIYAFQLPRLTAELERDVLKYFEEGFGTAVHTKGTPQMRTVPVNVSLTPERDVATYDDVRAHVRASTGPFAAMECICRLGKGLVGHPCVQTERHETCLTIGPAAEGMVRTGAARFEALRRAEDAKRNAQGKQELATVEGEISMLAAQLAAIRKLRKR